MIAVKLKILLILVLRGTATSENIGQIDEENDTKYHVKGTFSAEVVLSPDEPESGTEPEPEYGTKPRPGPEPEPKPYPEPEPEPVPACKCGIELPKKIRIIGGQEVLRANQYPWMVDLLSKQGEFWGCGGALVASKYVITAAHCISDGEPSKVRLGEHDRSVTGEGSLPMITIDVVKIIRHEMWNVSTFENDIAILEMAKEVDLTRYTPVCLARASDNTTFDGKKALVYGWGKTSSGDTADVLQEAEVTVASKYLCMGTMLYEEGEIITDDMLCAAGHRTDACQGDSGGPLTYKSGLQHVLIGDVSWGVGCAKKGLYGVYGRISHFREWIKTKMISPKYCGATADAEIMV